MIGMLRDLTVSIFFTMTSESTHFCILSLLKFVSSAECSFLIVIHVINQGSRLQLICIRFKI